MKAGEGKAERGIHKSQRTQSTCEASPTGTAERACRMTKHLLVPDNYPRRFRIRNMKMIVERGALGRRRGARGSGSRVCKKYIKDEQIWGKELAGHVVKMYGSLHLVGNCIPKRTRGDAGGKKPPIKTLRTLRTSLYFLNNQEKLGDPN